MDEWRPDGASGYTRQAISTACHDTGALIKVLPARRVERIIFVAVVAVLGFVIYARIQGNPEAFQQLFWLASWLLAVLLVLPLTFLYFFFKAPKRLHDIQRKDMAALNGTICQLRAELHARDVLQRKAAEYADALREGRKRLVEWVHAIRSNRDETIIIAKRRADGWLLETRTRLQTEFGQDIGERFNFGRPDRLIIGMSEPEEHQARLAELVSIMRDVRTGLLRPLTDQTQGPRNEVLEP